MPIEQLGQSTGLHRADLPDQPILRSGDGAVYECGSASWSYGAAVCLYIGNPINAIDPNGLSRNPKCMSCEKLEKDISNLISDLSECYQELVENNLDLPPTGEFSVGNHIQKFEGTQSRLRKALNERVNGNCGTVQENAWKWATRLSSVTIPINILAKSEAISIPWGSRIGSAIAGTAIIVVVIGTDGAAAPALAGA